MLILFRDFEHGADPFPAARTGPAALQVFSLLGKQELRPESDEVDDRGMQVVCLCPFQKTVGFRSDLHVEETVGKRA